MRSSLYVRIVLVWFIQLKRADTKKLRETEWRRFIALSSSSTLAEIPLSLYMLYSLDNPIDRKFVTLQ